MGRTREEEGSYFIYRMNVDKPQQHQHRQQQTGGQPRTPCRPHPHLIHPPSARIPWARTEEWPLGAA